MVEAVATDDELAEWQLDDGSAIAVSFYGEDDSSATILFGTTDENGDYYARLPESDMVYTVAAASVEELLNATPESLISTELVGTDYEDVKQAVFTADDVQYTITAEEDASTEEDTSDGEDPDETLWDTLTAISASTYLNEDINGKVVITVSVTTKDDISAEFSFAEYDADNYSVTDGLRTLLVDAASVDKLIRTVRTMG